MESKWKVETFAFLYPAQEAYWGERTELVRGPRHASWKAWELRWNESGSENFIYGSIRSRREEIWRNTWGQCEIVPRTGITQKPGEEQDLANECEVVLDPTNMPITQTEQRKQVKCVLQKNCVKSTEPEWIKKGPFQVYHDNFLQCMHLRWLPWNIDNVVMERSSVSCVAHVYNSESSKQMMLECAFKWCHCQGVTSDFWVSYT